MVRLFPEEDVLGELRKICQKHEVKTAIIFSGLGQLKEIDLGFFKAKGDYVPERFEQNFELLSLTGNISRQDGGYEFHLHAVFGDEKKHVTGGHFIAAKVNITAEIVLQKTAINVKRIREEETGLMGMFLE